MRCVEHRMDPDRELDGAQAPGEVTALGAADVEQEGAELVGHARERVAAKASQRARIFDGRECRFQRPLRWPGATARAARWRFAAPSGTAQRNSLTESPGSVSGSPEHDANLVDRAVVRQLDREQLERRAVELDR